MHKPGPLMWNQQPGAATRVHGFQINGFKKNCSVLFYAYNSSASHLKGMQSRPCLPSGSQEPCNSLPRFLGVNFRKSGWLGVRPCRLWISLVHTAHIHHASCPTLLFIQRGLGDLSVAKHTYYYYYCIISLMVAKQSFMWMYHNPPTDPLLMDT